MTTKLCFAMTGEDDHIMYKSDLFKNIAKNLHANMIKDPSFSVKKRRNSLVYKDFILQDQIQPFDMASHRISDNSTKGKGFQLQMRFCSFLRFAK